MTQEVNWQRALKVTSDFEKELRAQGRTEEADQWAATVQRIKERLEALEPRPLPLHRTEAGYPNCSTCDGGGCPDCTDPS